jgi:16S rRNA processing protein RimM
MLKLIVVGKITKPHGFRGSLVVSASGGTDSALGYVREVFVGSSPDTASPYSLENASWMPKGWKVKLKGLDSDEQVKAHRDELVFVNRDSLKDTDTNEFYIADLEGSEVFDDSSGLVIGKLIGIEPTNPLVVGDRWWIETETSEISVPATQNFISKVDPVQRKIWIKNWESLQ